MARRKRGRPDGSIRQIPSGSWEWRGSIDGAKVSITRPTRAELSEAVAARRAVAQAQSTEPEVITMRTLFARWMAAKARKASTIGGHERRWRKYLEPHIADASVRDMTAVRCATLLAAVPHPAQREKCQHMLAAMARFASIEGLGPSFTRGLAAPAARVKADKAYTRDELQAILHATNGRGLEVESAIRTLAMTGMRSGELLALSTREVDLRAGTIVIRGSRIQSAGPVRIDPPKTEASRRTIHIDDATVALLRTLAAKRGPGELLWPAGYGWLRPEWMLIVASARVPELPLHALRHTWATLALQAGTRVDLVSRRLGHADISVTLSTYAHSLPGDDSALASVVPDLLSRGE